MRLPGNLPLEWWLLLALCLLLLLVWLQLIPAR